MTPELAHHTYVHELRAIELRAEAAEFGRTAHLTTPLRTRLGMTLVSLGTRLAALDTAPVTARSHVTPCA
jgi:hypothetical protein